MMFEEYKKPINDKGYASCNSLLTIAFDQWQIQREEREGDDTCFTSYVLFISSPSKYCN